MNKYSSRIWNKLEPLENRFISNRDFFFSIVGAAIALLVVYVSMRHDTYGVTWAEFFQVLIISGMFYGFYYWFDNISLTDRMKVKTAQFEIEEIIEEIEKRSYTEGYRDGVSAANNDSIDPEFM